MLQGEFFQNPGGGGAFYDYQIEQSCRFDKASNSYINRTLGTVTANTAGTFSFWWKRGNIDSTTHQLLFVNDGGGINTYYESDDRLMFSTNNSGGAENMYTDGKYRDPNGWTHIVFAVNTNQGSNNDRCKVYINGIDNTSSGLNATINSGNVFKYNKTGNNLYFGHNTGATINPDGYLAEFIHVDGQQLVATDLGEFKNGVWKPIDYAGSYGAQGARLKFENASDLGNDSSGNNNDWTVNNMGADHQVLDSPTFGE